MEDVVIVDLIGEHKSEQQGRLLESLLTLAKSEGGLDHRGPLDRAEIAERMVRTAEGTGPRVGGDNPRAGEGDGPGADGAAPGPVRQSGPGLTGEPRTRPEAGSRDSSGGASYYRRPR